MCKMNKQSIKGTNEVTDMGKYEAQERYDKENTVQYRLKLNKNKDADIIEKLNSLENKQGYIKALIRADIK